MYRRIGEMKSTYTHTLRTTHMTKWKQKVKIYIYIEYKCVYCAVFLQSKEAVISKKEMKRLLFGVVKYIWAIDWVM